MSAIPAKQIERKRNQSDGRHDPCAPPAHNPRGGEAACCFVRGGDT
jgi:hypothetical protein